MKRKIGAIGTAVLMATGSVALAACEQRGEKGQEDRQAQLQDTQEEQQRTQDEMAQLCLLYTSPSPRDS